MTGSGGPTSPHKRYRQGDDELRLLIPSKVSGVASLIDVPGRGNIPDLVIPMTNERVDSSTRGRRRRRPPICIFFAPTLATKTRPSISPALRTNVDGVCERNYAEGQ